MVVSFHMHVQYCIMNGVLAIVTHQANGAQTDARVLMVSKARHSFHYYCMIYLHYMHSIHHASYYNYLSMHLIQILVRQLYGRRATFYSPTVLYT